MKLLKLLRRMGNMRIDVLVVAASARTERA